MAIVLNLLRLLVISLSLMLQCCQHHEVHDDSTSTTKKDLSKAASFNMQLGLGYLKQGDRQRAKKKLLTALLQAPQAPDVNAAMAYYFEQSEELDDARRYYQNAVRLSSNSGSQLNNFGTFLCRQGEYKKAEIYFLKAVKDIQYVNTAGAYENAGLCSLAIPDLDKAKIYFIQALKHDPSRRESLLELVKFNKKMGLNGDALNQLQHYPELVLMDEQLLLLAKELAFLEGNTQLSSEYSTLYTTIKLNNANSGVNDEYDSHSG